MVARALPLYSLSLLFVSSACASEPEAGELCDEFSSSETGGFRDAEVVGLADPGLDVIQLQHHPALHSGGHGLRAPRPAPLANIEIDDPRVPVVDEDDLQSYPLRTVVRVEMEIDAIYTTYVTTGTGFLVGPRHVLTNHHVVDDQNEEDTNLLLDMDLPESLFFLRVAPGASGEALFNGGRWNVERIVWGPNAWNGLFWGGEDYALLILEDDPDRSGALGYMGLCSPSNSTLEGLEVSTAGYPGEECANSPFAGPDACECGNWMYTQACTVTGDNLYPEEFSHDCVTNVGQSGSPLWVDECEMGSQVCAVGVHHGTLGPLKRAKRFDPATVNFLRQSICDSGSEFAPPPSFCG